MGKHGYSKRQIATKHQPRLIAGADEVGRGAWAGPLVAAAVILPHKHGIRGIRDSKKLSSAQRERLFFSIRKVAVACALHVVPSEDIDKEGISWANTEALRLAVDKLRPRPDEAVIDGFSIRMTVPSRAIIKGDEKHTTIAAASIVAKVTRDHMMVDYHHSFPAYGFDKHKGYGTAQHRTALRRHGVTPQHRRSFRPIREIVQNA